MRERQSMRARKLAITAVAAAAAACFGLAAPDAFAQAQAYTSEPVDLYAGPSADYPVVTELGPNVPVDVMGCVSDYSWCDVSLPGLRGWIYAGYLAYPYQGGDVPVEGYGATIGLPIVTFAIGSYWGSFYRDRPWYGDRERWAHVPPPGYGGRPPGPPPPVHGAPPGGGRPPGPPPGAGHPPQPGPEHPPPPGPEHPPPPGAGHPPPYGAGRPPPGAEGAPPPGAPHPPPAEGNAMRPPSPRPPQPPAAIVRPGPSGPQPQYGGRPPAPPSGYGRPPGPPPGGAERAPHPEPGNAHPEPGRAAGQGGGGHGESRPQN